MTSYEQRALEHLDEATDAAHALTAIYHFKPVDHDAAGRLRASVRFHLDTAQVYATLAQLQAADVDGPVPYVLTEKAAAPLDGREVAEALAKYERETGRRLP